MMEAVVVPAAQNVCTEQEFNEYMENEGTRMIWSVIHRYGKGVEQSDAFQELSIALWRALGSYSPIGAQRSSPMCTRPSTIK